MFLTRKAAGERFVGIALCLFVLVGVQASAANKRKISESTVIAKTASSVTIKPEGVRVSLEPVRKNQSLSARIARPSTGKSYYLVLKDIQTNKQPGELYHVYLNLEEGKTPAPEAAIGTLNFFNFERKPSSDSFFSFNVTEVLKRLVADRQLSEPLTITIIPAGTPETGAVPTIGQIELVEQ